MTKIINFIGGPGVGKSTTALGVAYNLKKRRLNIEYVAEYAKDVTWEGTHALLENQTHIFSEQFRRQFRLVGKVDFVVTDSPLLLSCVYHEYARHKLADPDYVEQVKAFYLASYKQFDNITYLVKGGVRPYNPVGRNQTEEEAAQVHNAVIQLLSDNGLEYKEILPEDAGVEQVLADLGLGVSVAPFVVKQATKIPVRPPHDPKSDPKKRNSEWHRVRKDAAAVDGVGVKRGQED